MAQDEFENSIREKFAGQTVKAPQNVWSGVDNALNAELVASYAAKNALYKRLAVAAMLTVALLLGVLYASTTFFRDDQSEYISYNALLSQGVDYGNYYSHTFSGLKPKKLSFEKIATSEKSEANSYKNVIVADTPFIETIDVSGVEVMFMNNKRPAIQMASSPTEIYPYHQGGAGVVSFRKSLATSKSEPKTWAGIEAGAGTFDANMNNSGALVNSLNTSELASAIGSENFVNPTANIAQNMQEAVATTVGFDFGVQLNKKWTLESGIAYTNVDNRGVADINVSDRYTLANNFRDFSVVPSSANGNNFIRSGESSRVTEVSMEKKYNHEVEIKNTVQFASIPLKAGYFVVDKKFSLRLNAGLAANYLVEGNITDASEQILNSKSEKLYNDWSFDGIGGLEFGYSLLKRVDFTLEPNYRYAITPINSSSSSPSRFVVQTGLRYTVK